MGIGGRFIVNFINTLHLLNAEDINTGNKTDEVG